MSAAPAPPGPAVPAPPRRRRRLWAAGLLVAVVALAAFVLVGRLGGTAVQPAVLVGRPAPALAGDTLDGSRFDLAAWRGQVVLVNVWGSWCGPCRQEAPLLAAAQSGLASRGLHVVGIDVRDRPQDARDFLGTYGGAGWPSVVDPDGALAVDWGTYALPESYVVDRGGVVVAKSTGPVTADWIDRAVVHLLAAQP
jgi:cytochrome c biogenesis protein CcmG, thiol:disulfide interchange protein DsbE